MRQPCSSKTLSFALGLGTSRQVVTGLQVRPEHAADGPGADMVHNPSAVAQGAPAVVRVALLRAALRVQGETGLLVVCQCDRGDSQNNQLPEKVTVRCILYLQPPQHAPTVEVHDEADEVQGHRQSRAPSVGREDAVVTEQVIGQVVSTLLVPDHLTTALEETPVHHCSLLPDQMSEQGQRSDVHVVVQLQHIVGRGVVGNPMECHATHVADGILFQGIHEDEVPECISLGPQQVVDWSARRVRGVARADGIHEKLVRGGHGLAGGVIGPRRVHLRGAREQREPCLADRTAPGEVWLGAVDRDEHIGPQHAGKSSFLAQP
mmetsp:Transcript_154261/g.494666  ORF Transcript_154261/g.494666 Transcript_154261/m.494666 type:complete len:320 (+) Transcript_154261:548-1507(+)